MCRKVSELQKCIDAFKLGVTTTFCVGVLMDVANELRNKGAVQEEECFIDAMFVMAKGGGSEIGTTKGGKGMKIMTIGGSPWLAALGQHACGEPSRRPLGATMLRLLHDRSQAGEFDRRSRL
jgi:hypothetical protein